MKNPKNPKNAPKSKTTKDKAATDQLRDEDLERVGGGTGNSSHCPCDFSTRGAHYQDVMQSRAPPLKGRVIYPK